MAQFNGFPPQTDQVSGVRELRCYILNPEPRTQNPELRTQIPEPGTLNPEP
jgi:hypothetical protein